MAYVVVVFSIINSLALLWVYLTFINISRDLSEMVETVIQDEVRKQDERIEKRLQRARGQAEDSDQTEPFKGQHSDVRPGVPLRR